MNVAITGGSGVLGKKLLKHLGASCKKIFVFKHSKNEIGEIDSSYTILSLICIEIWCKNFLNRDNFN